MVGWEDRRYVLLCNRAELLIFFLFTSTRFLYFLNGQEAPIWKFVKSIKQYMCLINTGNFTQHSFEERLHILRHKKSIMDAGYNDVGIFSAFKNNIFVSIKRKKPFEFATSKSLISFLRKSFKYPTEELALQIYQRDSKIVAFLWILRNFLEHLLLKSFTIYW